MPYALDREGEVPGRGGVVERIKYCKIDPKKIHLQAKLERLRSGAGFEVRYRKRRLIIDARSGVPALAIGAPWRQGEIRLYRRLFFKEDPEEDKAVDFKVNLNPDSLAVLTGRVLEPSPVVDAVGLLATGGRRRTEPGTCFVFSPDSRQANRLRNLSRYIQVQISPADRAE